MFVVYVQVFCVVFDNFIGNVICYGVLGEVQVCMMVEVFEVCN